MTDLKVTTAHVRELSARQGEAAAQVGAAGSATDGATQNMWMSHGVVCAAANMAVEAASAARKAACQAMAGVSQDLDQKLTTAAQRYDQIDQASQADIDGQMHPR